MNSALDTWNDKLAEIWTLLTQDPATFKGGGIWQVMLDINGALKAIGYGLLVLFFAIGVVKTCSSFSDLKRPEPAFKMFIRFALAKAAVGYGLDIMLAIFQIIQGMVCLLYTSLPSTHMKEFVREAKEHGLLYVPIRNKQKGDHIELVVFADDAAKIQRIYDNLGLDYVKAEAGEATVEKAAQQEQQAPAASQPCLLYTSWNRYSPQNRRKKNLPLSARK